MRKKEEKYQQVRGRKKNKLKGETGNKEINKIIMVRKVIERSTGTTRN
jgi:hypothetical protein